RRRRHTSWPRDWSSDVCSSDLDSRAYLIRNGEAVQLTRDQSLMQRLVEAGELTEEEAARSERRNIILQALGPDARVKVDLTHQRSEERRVGKGCGSRW